MRMKLIPAILIATVVLLGVSSTLNAQSLVPLADNVEEPLLPAGISAGDVEMFGELVYLWKAQNGENVVHFVGDFELQLGSRRLNADQAVIWMTPREHDEVEYKAFEIVLWQNARVFESAGSVTRGPVLFVTLNSSGQVRTSADQKSTDKSDETAVFERAERVRSVMKRRLSEDAIMESPITVIELSGGTDSPEFEVRPNVSYQGNETEIEQAEGRAVVTVIGDVYVFRGESGGTDPLELRADRAVVFLLDSEEPGKPDEDRPGRRGPGTVDDDRGGLLKPLGEEDGGMSFGAGGRVEGVYLEGDIILSSGERSIRASQLYYDFIHDRALILDAVMRTFEPTRNLPVYVRAEQIRQLSAREFNAKNSRLTTSEFYTPHYHIGIQDLVLTDRSKRDAIVPSQPGHVSGSFKAKHSTFCLEGLPVFYWPYTSGNLSDTETGLRGIRTGYSDDFGVEFESRWSLFNVMGLEQPAGFDGSLLLDYFSKRGPATGINLDYETDTYFGLYRGYYIHDTGNDDLAGKFRDEEPDTQNRGRSTIRHRQYLPNDWQLSFELSYISDKNFMEEYFQNEFDEGKDQETVLYLKKQVDNWAFTSLLQYRILDFVNTTERLPDFGFYLIGEPIGSFATLFSENRAGWVRYRRAERDFHYHLLYGGPQGESGTTARGDTRQELEVPLVIGDLKVVPFGSIRGSAWDDSPADGGVERVFGTFGLRGSMYAWKVFPDVRSDLLDINGLRHMVKADIVAWGSSGNRDSSDLYPFDENVEDIDEVDGVSFGIRQRFQTKRGAPGKQRIVDVLTVDLEMGLFNNADGDEYTNGFVSYSRPENSVTRNYVNAAVMYRVNDSTQVLSEANVDLNDGSLDNFNLSLAVERTPRLSYLLGYRYIGELDSNLLGAGMNYRISEKYSLALREQFDLDQGKTAEFDLGIIRKFPRWYVGVTFALNEVDEDFGVSVSAWPEGLPRATLGSSRFTGLATSTGIRPGQ